MHFGIFYTYVTLALELHHHIPLTLQLYNSDDVYDVLKPPKSSLSFVDKNR